MCVCVYAVTAVKTKPPAEEDNRVIWNGWEKLEHTRCSPDPRRKLMSASVGLRRHLDKQDGLNHVPFRLINTTTLEACVAACKSSDCPFVVRVVGAKDGNCRLATRSHSVGTHCHTVEAKKDAQGLRTTVYKRTSTTPLRYSLDMYADSVWTGADHETCVSWDIPKIRELQAGEQQIVDICA